MYIEAVLCSIFLIFNPKISTMILSKLSDSHLIEALHPSFKSVFDYLKQNDLSKVPTGRITLDADNIFINIDDAELRTQSEQVLEIHCQYIDIHIPLSGEEIVGWTPLDDLKVPSNEPFDVKRDFALYAQKASTYFTVKPGQFYIMFPEDAHAPIIGNGTLRKLIAKVRVV